MQRLFTIALVLVCAFSLSCSKSGGEANSNANADQQNQFAEITDANQALQIGSDLLENNETEKAIDALLRATELNPDLAEAWFKLGIAYSLIEKQQALDAQSDVNVPGDSQKQVSRTRKRRLGKRSRRIKRSSHKIPMTTSLSTTSAARTTN
jgi:hypothetical protein